MAVRTLNIGNMKGLWRVRHGKMLLWPPRVMPATMHALNARGKAGYVVDLDQPYEKNLLWGMEKFLEPVPDDQIEEARKRVQIPADFPRPILNYLAEHGLAVRTPLKRGPKKPTVVMAAREQEQKKPPAGGLPGLDQPPTGRRPIRRRRTEDPEDAAESDESPDRE